MEHLHGKEADHRQNESVPHIREHQSEDDEVEDTHDEGRVKRAVPRVGVHTEHPLEIGCELVVLEQNRRLFALFGVGKLVGAFKFIKRRRHTVSPFCRHPAGKNHAGFGFRQFLPRFERFQSGVFRVVQRFHRIKLPCQFGEPFLQTNLRGFQFRRPGRSLFRRAAGGGIRILEVHPQESEAGKDSDRFLFLGTEADRRHIPCGLFKAHRFHVCRSFAERGAESRHIDLCRKRPQKHGRRFGSGQIQFFIIPEPRRKRADIKFIFGQLGIVYRDLLHDPVGFVHRFPRRVTPALRKEAVHIHVTELREQGLLALTPFGQRRKRIGNAGKSLFGFSAQGIHVCPVKGFLPFSKLRCGNIHAPK